MVLPLIPLALGAASLATGALGLKKGFDAKKSLEKARQIGEKAQRHYDEKIKELDERREHVNSELEGLGQYKTQVFKQTLGYVVQQIRNARSSIEGIDEHILSIDVREVEIIETELTRISALDVSSGSMQGIAAGTAGAFGAYGTVGLLASASTGTAISSLSGAAATNATLAWLGGGSLATGGLGVAGGTWVLGGLVAGPALAIAGYALASKAEEALTKAEEYKAEVDIAIAELNAPTLLLDAIKSNIDETRYVLAELVQRFAIVRLDYEKHLRKDSGWRSWLVKLRGRNYQAKINQIKEEKLEKIIYLGKSIKAVIGEPLLDSTGAASPGFKTKIAGIVNVGNIDSEQKKCLSCGNAISSFVRICPECNDSQSVVVQQSPVKEEAVNTKIIAIGLIGALALILATVYWMVGKKFDNLSIIPSFQQSVSTPVQNVEVPVSVSSKKSLIDQVFQKASIGMSLPYFEKIAGSAKYIQPNDAVRTYEIDGCEVAAYLNNGDQKTIRALNVKITPACHAKIGNFVWSEAADTTLNTLTFANLEKILGDTMSYSANCLINCGNAYDPSVYAHWSGPRALDSIEVMAEVVMVEDAALEAANKWAEAMVAVEGEEWVTDNKFNCERTKFSQLAKSLFSAVKLDSLTIGHDLDNGHCQN